MLFSLQSNMIESRNFLNRKLEDSKVRKVGRGEAISSSSSSNRQTKKYGALLSALCLPSLERDKQRQERISIKDGILLENLVKVKRRKDEMNEKSAKIRKICKKRKARSSLVQLILIITIFLLVNPLLLQLKSQSQSESSFLAEATSHLVSPEMKLIKHQHSRNNDNNNDNQDDQEDPDSPSAGEQNGNPNRDTNDVSDRDNIKPTRIPLRQQLQATTTTTTTTTTTKRPTASKRLPSLMRITEAELLPFADFNVHQPAFTDLMKTWPPTSQESLHQSTSNNNNNNMDRFQQQSQSRWLNEQQYRQTSEVTDGRANLHNHLNEDLDDTLLTADQSFETDQTVEPSTWINYLGDLGDYIYTQLKLNSERRQQQQQHQTTVSRLSSSDGQTQSNRDNESLVVAVAKQQQQTKIDSIEELLDDYYYGQYENSQVLYYGPQLVREGDIFEIGCYLPKDQVAEWTKSGRPLANITTSSPRVFRSTDFMGAKQNFSFKIFEASLTDSGNYRCTKMSRKYHKLVVVPLQTSSSQLYMIQQRLLSVVSPKLATTLPPNSGLLSTRSSLSIDSPRRQQNFTPANRLHSSASSQQQSQSQRPNRDYLLPGHLIFENQPLVIDCNITDDHVLRRLRELPSFQLVWYKNGKQLRGSMGSQASNQSPSNPRALPAAGGQQQQQPVAVANSLSSAARASGRVGSIQQQQQQQQQRFGSSTNQRVQFLQANGRQMYITSALYSDAGDYLCSWSKLPDRQQPGGDLDSEQSDAISTIPNGPTEYQSSSGNGNGVGLTTSTATIASNPLAAGSLVQLLAPVKLRPFKSTYNVRENHQLRLVCQIQRGYPSAQISWYVGNRLVDGDFLKEQAGQMRILHLQNHNQAIVTSWSQSEEEVDSNNGTSEGAQYSTETNASTTTSMTNSTQQTGQQQKRLLVEINPVPAGKQQLQLTANGRGKWVEYKESGIEKYNIDSADKQLKYLQLKLGQLTGTNLFQQAASSSIGAQQQQQQQWAANDPSGALFGQTSVSVLVINSLLADKHTARYACRATTRANTDEVTTVIRVQASTVMVQRPSSRRAVLVPGQPIHMACEAIQDDRARTNAGFLWYKRKPEDTVEVPLDPNDDDTIEIHNERLILHKPTANSIGDYICRLIKDDNPSETVPKEFATVRVRPDPYIEDFGQETSHTGKSTIITEGERLELTCTVKDQIGLKLKWLRSATPDSDHKMVPILDIPLSEVTTTTDDYGGRPGPITLTAAEQEIIIETVKTNIVGTFTKRLIIESVKHEHRGYYTCVADNDVSNIIRKTIFVRVKDKLVALWPFLGIVAELFILFTIIHIWETQRAYKEINTPSATGAKRLASGTSAPFESVPLARG